MSLRERLLQKYGPSKKKDRSSSNKRRVNAAEKPSSVIVTSLPFANPLVTSPHLAPFLQDETFKAEDEPVKVDMQGKREFKGFKRIDNGKEVVNKQFQTSIEQPQHQNPKTVYRDSHGRIVDIEKKRAEYAQKQEELRNSKLRSEIKLSESEQLLQSNETRKRPPQPEIDDPLFIFKPESSVRTSDLYQYYSKGTQPLNRFNLQAGYFWDGIDRSNGFEELLMRKRNTTKFTARDRAIGQVYDLDDDSM